jgi:2-aminoethylphosphonate-pyruvate transaminase
MILGLDVLDTTPPPHKDKALFTPGPLNTSVSTKRAMLRDLGSRDAEFIQVVKDVRSRLVGLGDGHEEYTSIIMQGSGTFGVEAILSSVIPQDGKLLILINGAYGERMLKIAGIHRIQTVSLRTPEDTVPSLQSLREALEADPQITHVAVVHCETTTGIINPIKEYGKIVREFNRIYFVDAMSSFGAYPVDLHAYNIDYLISSSNKCIEGVPGFSFILARTKVLQATKGLARTLSLDLYAQWEGLERDGQFRFTPPIHTILAFRQALVELEKEGGVTARGARYKRNYETTLSAMEAMGFKPYLPPEHRGYIITSFHYPPHPNFDFHRFYELLSEKRFLIYPGKLSHADCFRIGHVGYLSPHEVKGLMSAIASVLKKMQIKLTE